MDKKLPPLASKQLEPLLTPLSDIRPHPDNYKVHPSEQIKALRASLKAFGVTSPIKANLEGFIVAGHGMYQLYLEDGYTHAPVLYEALDSNLSKAYLVADNETARKGITEQDKLNELLEGALSIPDFDIEAVGFSNEDIDSLLKDEPGEVVEDDFNPDEVVETRCKEGDLWALGSHRLLCGDSTKREDVERLLNGANIDLLLTDPPYGIEVVGGGGVTKFGKVGGDKPTTFNKDLPTHFSVKVGGENIVESKTYMTIKGDSTTETAYKAYSISSELEIQNMIIWGGNYFTDFLKPSRCWIVWDKENTGNFADAELAWTSFEKGVKLYHWLWNGLSRKGDRESELISRVHPTQKPVGLHGEIIRDFTQEGANILDLFLGSGTTLIACEQTGRTCYGIEYEKEYCNIIISRWEKFTGQTAKRLD